MGANFIKYYFEENAGIEGSCLGYNSGTEIELHGKDLFLRIEKDGNYCNPLIVKKYLSKPEIKREYTKKDNCTSCEKYADCSVWVAALTGIYQPKKELEKPLNRV